MKSNNLLIIYSVLKMFNITYQVKETYTLSEYPNTDAVTVEDIVVYKNTSGKVIDIRDKISIMTEKINCDVTYDEIKKMNFRQSLVGNISIAKELQSVEVVLVENIFRKKTDTDIVFYHEIPSVSSTLKNTIIYYSKSEHSDEIEASLAEIYDEITYDFLNVADYVETHIFKKLSAA